MTDADHPNQDWDSYYDAIAGRELRPVFVQVMGLFDREPPPDSPRSAIDLGCGEGTETRALLAAGWEVLATDREAEGLRRVVDSVSDEHRSRLTTQQAAFHDVTFRPAHLIYAGYSLPFCHPDHFDTVWNRIVDALPVGGRFTGQFFGVNDTWAIYDDMTFHTEEGVRNRFSGFEIEHFSERDEDGASTSAPKHWHVFDIIARKLA